MPIYDLFSKRRADAARQGEADVYRYDIIPRVVRNQIQQIAVSGLGVVEPTYGGPQNPKWEEIFQIYTREKGVHALGRSSYYGEQILIYMSECSTDDWLDLLELICLGITLVDREKNWAHRGDWGIGDSVEGAVDEINYRLRQGGVGYQFEVPHIVRVDSQYVHAEVVKPALSLLSGPGFQGPQEEFLAAHKHYRAGEHRQAVAMAANALESTFKAIYEKKGWSYNKGARISDLVKVGRENGLWPDYLDKSFEQLVATLQSGLPKIRDNDASHGQGAELREVPSYVAAYALHLAAAKIVFIVEAAQV